MTRVNLNLNNAAQQLSMWNAEGRQDSPVFTSNSPINQQNLTGQNKIVYEHLLAGNTLNFIQARDLGIGFLNSRIAELKGYDIEIYSRMIRVNGSACKEYSLTPFENTTA